MNENLDVREDEIKQSHPSGNGKEGEVSDSSTPLLSSAEINIAPEAIRIVPRLRPRGGNSLAVVPVKKTFQNGRVPLIGAAKSSRSV